MKELPVAIYRIQLNKSFTFLNTSKIADYLRELNISHLYLSPILSSAPASNHGYDVTDFNSISEERGGMDGFLELIQKICAYDYPMKMILDIVPNHMATNYKNPFWQDALKNGVFSRYWHLFDFKVSANEKIHLPILEKPLPETLKAGEIELIQDEQGRYLKYGEIILPINDLVKDTPDIQKILDAQYYLLCPWQDTSENMSYRRFFNVTGLIGVRVEDKDIYDSSHKFIFELFKEFPCISGIRVDHIDGLANPEAYLNELSKIVPDVWIEKILGREEKLSDVWSTCGTTGYEFIDRINQLFVHPDNFEKIKTYWIENLKPEWQNFHSCVLASKQEALEELFPAELARLIQMSQEAGMDAEMARVFWTGMTIGLPVYRTYHGQDSAHWLSIASQDAEQILGPSFTQAENSMGAILQKQTTELEKKIIQEWRQLTGPVMAKGLEDRAHYRFTPFAALNEVGCSPELSCTTIEDYFNWLQTRADKWPFAINATSTHDTKRSEDARHRLYALADHPDQWLTFFEEACTCNAPFSKNDISLATEYFLYQALVSCWPLDQQIDDEYRERIHAYMLKASREAGLETSWPKPDKEFEATLAEFIDRILISKKFVALTNNFSKVINRSGAINSLSVQTLKILSPGIPDIYQGTETWDYSLVDPDNRRPVDYALRQELLFVADDYETQNGRLKLLEYLSENWQDGTVKVWLTRELLKIRQEYLLPLGPKLCVKQLPVAGNNADCMIACSISDFVGTSGLIVCIPRYPGLLKAGSGLSIDWEDTQIELGKNFNTYIFHDHLHNRAVDKEDFKSLNIISSALPISVISFTKK